MNRLPKYFVESFPKKKKNLPGRKIRFSHLRNCRGHSNKSSRGNVIENENIDLST